MKNFDSSARDGVAVGHAVVRLYADACMAANQAMMQYAKFLSTMVWQSYSIPVVAAHTGADAVTSPGIASPVRDALPEVSPQRDLPAVSPQHNAAATNSPRDGAAPETRNKRTARSRPAAATVAAPRKAVHKKAPASAAQHRAGVAKRRVRAAR